MIKAIFVGGKPIGVACLELLLDHPDVDVVAVFVNPDDYNEQRWYPGRTALQVATEEGIPVFDKINAEIVKKFNPNILFCVYYDKLLKPDVIAIPPMGCINLHLALAEEYRGCYPTTWAIINGETRTGATLHYIDAGMDTGDIIDQCYTDITPFDTGKSLYLDLVMKGYELFKRCLPAIITGTNSRRKQVTTEKTRVYHREFPDYQVPFTGTAQDVYNYIRALIFPPFKEPYIMIGDKKYRITECQD